MSIEALEQRIADLRARLPRHSVPAAMLLELEALEETLEALRTSGDRELEAEN
jgi:HAMP domain-containing protein